MMTLPASVLVADQDVADRHALCDCLEEQGFRVREAADGRRLLADLHFDLPHLIVLDLQLPPIDAEELCRSIKRRGDIPIVVLTALDDQETKLAYLHLYAEDYIVKPARSLEVVARIRRILCRTWLTCLPAGPSVKVDQQLSLDFLRREARTPSGVHRLTPTESRLLELFVRNAGQVLPATLILERLWGDEAGSVNCLWEYVRRVRHKIGDDAANPRYILNEPGLGYRFCRPATNDNCSCGLMEA